MAGITSTTVSPALRDNGSTARGQSAGYLRRCVLRDPCCFARNTVYDLMFVIFQIVLHYIDLLKGCINTWDFGLGQ